MFARILIANRGEIACRIIGAARAMGIATVAVYSEADRRALHVQMADEAVAIGPAAPERSYLDIAAIIAACKASGAEAVHPGYGFLSERAEFAEALARAGIVFIGPNAKAIEAVGDKIAAKNFAREAGLSTVPGSAGAVDDAGAARVAAEIGYPVMIKAAAGGGGKGMRIAATETELAGAIARARSEARSSFGDDRVLIEKFIADPRHIEVQLLCDRHGGVVHLGERECSIQRRHQKLIEEAPSPFVDAPMRAAMAAEAAALARAVGYDSAGTVEFIVGPLGDFYFLEMNARLQVEHPVTEMVAGVDIVEQMIRIAAGEPLSMRQSDVRLRGHAIETRICAEDPQQGFLPSAGRLTLWRPPDLGALGGAVTVRLDAGVFEGAEVPIDYDPLMAKLIVHADDRSAATLAQAQALDQFAIEGVRHNLLFLGSVMEDADWRAGALSTGFIARAFPAGFRPAAPSGEAALRLAAVAAAIDHRLRLRRRMISGQTPGLAPPEAAGARSVLLGATRIEVRTEETAGGLTIRFAEGGPRVCASDWRAGEPVWRGAIDGERIAVGVRAILNGHTLTHRGGAVDAYVFTPREADLAALVATAAPTGGSSALICPMPALLKAVHVVAGEAVKAGQPLCVIEAMKMESVLCAEQDATVAAVCARVGDRLAVDEAIMRFV